MRSKVMSAVCILCFWTGLCLPPAYAEDGDKGPLSLGVQTGYLGGNTTYHFRERTWSAAAVFAFPGRGIGAIAAASDILSRKMLLIFAALGLLTLLPVIRKRVTAKGGPDKYEVRSHGRQGKDG